MSDPRAQPGQVTLAVIDVQQRLVPAMAGFGPVLRSVRRLVQGMQTLGVPCVVTEQYPRGLGPTLPSLARLLPGPYHEKTAFSCYGCESFVDALGERRDLVLCGIEAHVCVLETALAALADGRRVFIAGDAVTSRRPADRDRGLAQAAAAGATVTGVESLLFSLLGCAGTAEFKAVSKLVK